MFSFIFTVQTFSTLRWWFFGTVVVSIFSLLSSSSTSWLVFLIWGNVRNCWCYLVFSHGLEIVANLSLFICMRIYVSLLQLQLKSAWSVLDYYLSSCENHSCLHLVKWSLLLVLLKYHFFFQFLCSKFPQKFQLTGDWTQVQMISIANEPGVGLGFGIVGGTSTGVVVKTILPGSPADKVHLTFICKLSLWSRWSILTLSGNWKVINSLKISYSLHIKKYSKENLVSTIIDYHLFKSLFHLKPLHS